MYLETGALGGSTATSPAALQFRLDSLTWADYGRMWNILVTQVFNSYEISSKNIKSLYFSCFDISSDRLTARAATTPRPAACSGTLGTPGPAPWRPSTTGRRPGATRDTWPESTTSVSGVATILSPNMMTVFCRRETGRCGIAWTPPAYSDDVFGFSVTGGATSQKARGACTTNDPAIGSCNSNQYVWEPSTQCLQLSGLLLIIILCPLYYYIHYNIIL